MRATTHTAHGPASHPFRTASRRGCEGRCRRPISLTPKSKTRTKTRGPLKTFYKRVPANEIDDIGLRWVREAGGSPRPIYDRRSGTQTGWLSGNGERVYRFPQRKTSGPSAGDVQANLVDKSPGAESNFHITIVP